MTKFTILIQKASIEEGGYSGQCLEIPAAISQGENIDELKENMKEAIELAMQTINDLKKDLKKDAFVEALEVTV
jgi:predicted RNase H-like HicB family nuclease